MIDGLELARMRDEAAEISRANNQQPFVPDAKGKAKAMDGDWTGVNIPNFGDYRPEGWELGETYFVDKTGFDDQGPALSIERFLVQMRVGLGYAMIEEGQFQCYVGEFNRTEEGKQTMIDNLKQPDPDAGIDRPVGCHNLDRAPLQRLSHPCQSEQDYHKPGNPAGSVRIIYTLEDGRFLVATPDEHGIERYYIADERTCLVLVEDVTNQFVAEDRNYATGALPDAADKETRALYDAIGALPPLEDKDNGGN